jgi:putative IMPACT (imprinted ancient) family translation regulator
MHAFLYPEATHYVYGWRIDRPVQLQRFSDDGEPQGTAGRQVLEVILREEIDRVAIVVVRYFGGIKLGTGGLTRAYSHGARGALFDAQPIEYHPLPDILRYDGLRRLPPACRTP